MKPGEFPTSQRFLTPWQWGWLALQLAVLGVVAVAASGAEKFCMDIVRTRW
jgi:hypothetical protein